MNACAVLHDHARDREAAALGKARLPCAEAAIDRLFIAGDWRLVCARHGRELREAGVVSTPTPSSSSSLISDAPRRRPSTPTLRLVMSTTPAAPPPPPASTRATPNTCIWLEAGTPCGERPAVAAEQWCSKHRARLKVLSLDPKATLDAATVAYLWSQRERRRSTGPTIEAPTEALRPAEEAPVATLPAIPSLRMPSDADLDARLDVARRTEEHLCTALAGALELPMAPLSDLLVTVADLARNARADAAMLATLRAERDDLLADRRALVRLEEEVARLCGRLLADTRIAVEVRDETASTLTTSQIKVESLVEHLLHEQDRSRLVHVTEADLLARLEMLGEAREAQGAAKQLYDQAAAAEVRAAQLERQALAPLVIR